jgi:Zn-dependent protease
VTAGPLIYVVRDRKTVYADGRRLMLPDQFESGTQYDLSQKHALPQNPRLKDSVRSMLFDFELLSEPQINRLCDHIAWLAPVRNVLPISIALICINLFAVSCLYFWPIEFRTFFFDTGLSVGVKVALIFVAQLAIMFAHELAHCSSARQMGIRVDSLGASTYLFMPAMYSKISLVALLEQRERIIVFWAGLLLQLTVSPFLFSAYLVYRVDILYSIFVINIVAILFNMYPIARLDGYRILVEFLKSPTAPRLVKKSGPAILKGLEVLTTILMLYFLLMFSISVYVAVSAGSYLRDINLILTTCIVLFFFIKFIYGRLSDVRRT